MRPTVAFSRDDAQRAAADWGFNCGPGAICAVTGLTPDQLRPHMGDFEKKYYTNPSLMVEVLTRLGLKFRQVYRSDSPMGRAPRVPIGLVRIQWGGRWTNPGVPVRARYRHTHWIAVHNQEVFDINAICAGGWMPSDEWRDQLVPWLLRECVPGHNGEFWPTHAIEVIA